MKGAKTYGSTVSLACTATPCEKMRSSAKKLRRLALGFIAAACFLPCLASAQLNGSYTVDSTKAASKTNYKDIMSAVTDLDSGKRYDGGTAMGPGVSGPVTITIAGGLHKFPNIGTSPTIFSIYSVPGTSAANTITFTSSSGDSSKTILRDAVFVLSQMQHITFKNIGFAQTGGKGYECFALSRCTDVTFTHCLFQTAGKDIAILAYSLDSSFDVKVDHTNFQGEGFGMFMNMIHGLSVHDNTLTPVPASSGLTDGNLVFASFGEGKNINFSNNVFLRPTDSAITIFQCKNVKVTGNKINARYGITLSGESGDSIVNNSIISHIYGVYAYICDHLNIIYNDVYTDSAGTKKYGYGIFIWYSGSGTNIVANNNIISGKYRSAIYLKTSAEVSLLDYNNYYYADSIGSNLGTRYKDLASFAAASGFEKHGHNIDSKANLNNYMKPGNSALAGRGLNINDVAFDIDGNARRSRSSSVGAYEFAYSNDSLNTCKGNCLVINAPVAGRQYLWSTGAATRSITYCPNKKTALTVKVWTGPGATDYNTYTDYVDDTKCVWPGDANNDGSATITDLLPIGVGYGETGPQRQNASSGWAGQPCDEWKLNFKNGVNHKFADCDGNGTIDSSDVALIAGNFSKTHSKATAVASGNPSDPPLSVTFSKDSVQAGDTVTAIISLGSSSIKASNVYGVTASISYADFASSPKKMAADFSKSWLGAIHKDMISLVVNDDADKIIYVGLSRTDHNNASGNGEIGALSIYMPDNLAGKREVKELFNLKIIDCKAINATEDSISLNPMGDSVTVYQDKSGIENLQAAGVLAVYPNPVSNFLNIHTDGRTIDKIEITDAMGNTVYSIQKISGDITVPVSHLPSGIYYIQASSSKGSRRSRFIKE